MNNLESVDRLLTEIATCKRRLVFLGGMGFEDRALAFVKRLTNTDVHGVVVAVRYQKKGLNNREAEFTKAVSCSSTLSLVQVRFSQDVAHKFEIDLDRALRGVKVVRDDLVVLDVSGLTKFLIMVCLLRLWSFGLTVQLVMTTAVHYTPTEDDFNLTMAKNGGSVRAMAGQPSSGASAILRSLSLISPRMQGKPVCAIAFTSFNEALIRHAVGTINPHRLILINGMPPSGSNMWRAKATQVIHSRLINENSVDNPIDESTGLLKQTVSTLYYQETARLLQRIHTEIGLYERMIYFATGSKMQAVALAVHKIRNQDVHIEYPNPSSYFFKEYSSGADSTYCVELDPNLLLAEQNYLDERPA